MLSLKQKTNKHKNNTTLSSCKKKKRKKKNICKQMPVHVILLWLSSLDIIMPFQEAKENLFGIKQETTLFFRLFKLPTTLSMLHLSWNQDNDKIYVWVNDFSDKQTKKCEASQWKWVNDILSDKKKHKREKQTLWDWPASLRLAVTFENAKCQNSKRIKHLQSKMDDKSFASKWKMKKKCVDNKMEKRKEKN